MAVSLLEVDGEVRSLEFDEADLKEISEAIIDRFGEIRIYEKTPTYSEIAFGGERFIHYYEWTPCLLSQTGRGKAMLRLIAADCSTHPIKPPLERSA